MANKDTKTSKLPSPCTYQGSTEHWRPWCGRSCALPSHYVDTHLSWSHCHDNPDCRAISGPCLGRNGSCLVERQLLNNPADGKPLRHPWGPIHHYRLCPTGPLGRSPHGPLWMMGSQRVWQHSFSQDEHLKLTEKRELVMWLPKANWTKTKILIHLICWTKT